MQYVYNQSGNSARMAKNDLKKVPLVMFLYTLSADQTENPCDLRAFANSAGLVK